MNKSELVAQIAAKSDTSKVNASAMVEAMVEIVGDSLKAGESVQISGFGAFKVTDRAARMGRNPKTGESIQIKASRSPSFKAGKGLKDKVNS
ncbi:MAG: HU family DNA-binding protein [Thiotrichales bacterium]|jgi:DNA-binding protein HU-beta|nr:HU family DNA-binding protein [Thiotrichales bacterium]MBT3614165.1 HU family DNA-binding protein [Thiotrichales bacterium]MBT3751983.1 HU family DNA-binding protein [Thiotrichales bacterium]MBT3837366.1 HU family DNA-binding protein [Thiotrichales bacterium]MBT4152651.1 HU family DNA-binding protein [Thiotrichales bacterium]